MRVGELFDLAGERVRLGRTRKAKRKREGEEEEGNEREDLRTEVLLREEQGAEVDRNLGRGRDDGVGDEADLVAVKLDLEIAVHQTQLQKGGVVSAPADRRKEGRKEGRKERRKEGRKEGGDRQCLLLAT